MIADTAIIIPTFGQEEFTARCFDSIAEHTRGHLLVWVDNGSGRESRDVVAPAFARHAERVSIWNEGNLGFVKAVNQGLSMVLGRPEVKFVVIQNNDTIVTAGWLDLMKAVMREESRVGAVGPVTTYGANQQAWKFIWDGKGIDEENSVARQKALSLRYGGASRDTPILTFFCTLFRREVFDGLGLLDEDYGVGLWDDQDLCDKMRRSGWRLSVALGAYVRHHHRTTFKAVYSKERIEEMKRANQKVFTRKKGARDAAG